MRNKISFQIDHALRESRQAAIAAGSLPDFRAETAELRAAEWSVEAPAGSRGQACYLAGVQAAGEAEAWLEGRDPDAAPTVLWVDSIWGALEIEEILFCLKEAVCGVECDVDGYLLSIVEAFQDFPAFVLPDRADITPGTHLVSSFTRLVGSVGRRRGVPVEGASPEAGADGERIEAADLLLVPRGRITERGMGQNIRVALDYLVNGRDGTAEDDAAALRSASAARLAAAQLWQWVRHETGVLAEGRIVTSELFREMLAEEVGRRPNGEASERDSAAAALGDTVLSKSFTMHAFCDRLIGNEGES
jgi:malate synthase